MPVQLETDTAILRIQNTTDSPYIVEELAGHILASGGDVNLLDANLPQHYMSYADVRELIDRCTTAKLHQDILSGDIIIIEDVSPEMPAFDGF